MMAVRMYRHTSDLCTYMNAIEGEEALTKKLNAFAIRRVVEQAAGGPVKGVTYCRTGALLIEAIDYSQVMKLIKCKSVYNNQIKIKVEIAEKLNTTLGIVGICSRTIWSNK